MIASENSYKNSTLRERIVEHLFIGELLRRLWCAGIVDVQILRSEFDAFGYDLVIVRGALIRHIQLKTTSASKRSPISVSTLLSANPSGCVVWVGLGAKLQLETFYWFGGAPGQPIPSLDKFSVPRRPTHNKMGVRPERANHRLVPPAIFKKVSFDELIVLLLGDCYTGSLHGIPFAN